MKKLENAFKVAEHIDAMLAFWDKDLICRYANSSYLKWFGLSPLDLIDKITLPQLLGPLYKQNARYINNALAGKLQVFERNIAIPNGELKNTIATYTPEIINGIVTGFYAHVADISTVKNHDLQAREQGEDYLGMSIAQNYLNGVEDTLRSSLFTKFPGIATLAKQYYVSPTKLKKDFKARYHDTVFSFYRSLQMQVADRYVREKIYSKAFLANMFGFENQSNFSKCFNKYFSSNNYTGNIISDPGNKNKAREEEQSITTDKWEKAFHLLKDEFEMLKTCNDVLYIGTWERDFETSQTKWNEMAKQILGLPPEFEPNFSPALNFYKTVEDRELAKRCLNEAFNTGNSFDFQAQIITAMGYEKRIRVLGFTKFQNNVCKKMFGIFQELR